MRFSRSPDPTAARALLDDLLSRPAAAGPRRLDGPFALYGAGKLGEMAMDFLDHIGARPEFVVDAAAEAAEARWRGVPLLSPERVPEASRRALPLVVSIATLPFGELADGLRAQGWREVVPLYDVTEAYRDRYPLGNGWFMEAPGAAGRTAIERVLEGWSDDHSRAAHLQFIAWHRLREDWVFDDAPVTLDDRYFIPELLPLLGERECFVDLGAHRGEVAERFRQVVGDRFDAIVLMEPDPRNAAAVEEGLRRLPGALRERHRLLPWAASRSGGEGTFFAGLGYGSQLSALGDERVPVVALDDLGLAPSFLKLHLEGHELEALRGARRTLLRHRPIIALTVYHGESGVHRLPGWLMETLPDYRHHLRLHGWCGTGAVMYCVPEERAGAVPRGER